MPSDRDRLQVQCSRFGEGCSFFVARELRALSADPGDGRTGESRDCQVGPCPQCGATLVATAGARSRREVTS